jgi:thymidylate kinase
MIIELFGPPGAGKTTFVRALTARLLERGHRAEFKLSLRPTERLRSADPIGLRAIMARRLTRPFVEMLTLACHPLVNAQHVRTSSLLVRTCTRGTAIGSIREFQYLARLSYSWHRAANANHIVIFDQAYVQALCSLAVVRRVDDTVLAQALDFAPKADLLIRMIAPLEVVKSRLHDRSCGQSTIERMFERKLEANLDFIQITGQLERLLRRRGRPVICVSSLDTPSLREGVERIEQELNSKWSGGLHAGKEKIGRASKVGVASSDQVETG